MQKSTITIGVQLDDNKVPEDIEWSASASTAEDLQKAKAMLLSLWDGREKSALRIDLWTKNMMIDEMGDFYYQTLYAMADTLVRATHQQELADELRSFAKKFYEKFRAQQLKDNKLS